MYLRTTRQRRTQGPDALSYQLAEHDDHTARRRSETRVLSTFGRADQVDPEALRRLAQSLLRVANDDRLDLPARQCPLDVGIDAIEPVSADGVLDAARALWEKLGLGPRRREPRQQDSGHAPHDTALFAMTANRLARPASTFACYARWLADDGEGPEAQALAREHRSRALDFLLQHRESLEPELCCRTAALCHADVDLIFWATTTLACEIDAEDDAREPWQDRTRPALRQRGPQQEGRAGNPQVVVGLALTRDGWPGRSWVFPGHTAEVTTITHLKADVRGWRLNRCVVVGASGMCAEANRPRLSRALGRYLLAVPRRQVTAVPRDVLARAGRSRDVAPNLRVKEVSVGEGERRRRALLGHHPDAAAREQAPREPLVDRVRAERAGLDARPADPPQKVCALLAARRFGRARMMDARGRLRIDTQQVAAEATDEGKFVVTTTDATLAAADGARGYTRMPRLEGGFRQMKTTGLQTRPLSQWRPHRLSAPVKLWVLA